MQEYRLGPKSVLTKGSKVRVTDGPEWVTGDRRIPMRARGVMTFNYAFCSGGCEYIDAESDKDGHVVLHVSGERSNPAMPELDCRPYRITGRVGTRKGGDR